ncbi:MAG: glycosyltransferase involved in cell wall biosynthesis [Gammaproteobacteria bacterium]|jgi:glycosyltransferase involved in cell wall biosynthesis
MRVLEVMECTIGGTRRHLVDLAGGLVGCGDDVHLVVAVERMAAFRTDLQALEARGCTVHELPMVRSISPKKDLAHKREIARLLRELRPDVVHTHSSKAGVLGRSASMSTGIGARVHTPHTFAFLFDAMFSAPKRMLFRGVEKHLAKGTDRMIAVSQGEASTMIEAGVVAREKVCVVANGVDPESWSGVAPASRQELGIPDTGVMVLVAGLLNSAKGQDLAIEAMGQVRSEQVYLVLAGHGEELEALQALAARLGVEHRVRFLGWRDDVPALVAAADIVLLPSRWEGMPYVVLEAMAAARPVVATRVDGATDLVVPGQTGELVDVLDVAGIAAALDRMAEQSPEQRALLGQAGEARIRSAYCIEHMVAATRKVFRAATGSGNSTEEITA